VCSRLTSEGDSATQYIKSRPLAESRAAPADLQRCRVQLEECLRHEELHKKCRKAMKRVGHNTAPTRLLCTRHSSHGQLYTVPREEHPDYAALSYCWGNSRHQVEAKTTIANVHDRHCGMDFSQLPQTIKDAIEVCRSLGLTYLWVDALCIIQDDPEDQASEVTKMASIYRGATITISAASAEDSTQGFLGDRDLARAYGSLFQLPYLHKRGEHVIRGSVFLSELSIHDTYEEPIDKRAWTMQEDMVSLRLIRFGSKQTTWRCPTFMDNERIPPDGGGHEWVSWKQLRCVVTDPTRVAEMQLYVAENGSYGPRHAYRSWQDMICKYTRRKLSNPRDKLPACLALAENFADILSLDPSEYLAGLWKGDLAAQLLWYRPEGESSVRCSGPTWSWVSIDGPIVFSERRAVQDAKFRGAVLAECVESTIELKAGHHKYSEVVSGRLRLEGRLAEAYWDGAHLRRSFTCPVELYVNIHLDVSTSIRPQTVWCFEILGGPGFLGLGLVLVMKNETDFERVGFFYWNYAIGLFNDIEPGTISLC
jgi:hypothetical protein